LRGRLGDAEVEQLDPAVVSDEHVGTRDVAVHDPQGLAVEADLLVGVVQTSTDPLHDMNRELEGNGPPGTSRVTQHGTEIFAVQVGHGEEVVLTRLTDVVDVDDVGMLEVGRDASLVEEHADEVLVCPQVRQDPLEHDDFLEALDPRALGEEDLGHASHRQLVQQQVATQLFANHAGR